MLFVLITSAQAQFFDPESNAFIQEISAAMQTGDHTQVIAVVTKDPDRAERVFNKVYAIARSYPGALQHVGEGLSAVAFVLDAECDRSGPKQTLEAAGAYRPAPGLVKLAENPSQAPLATGDLANAEVAEISIRTGNYRLAQTAFRRLTPTPENRLKLFYAYAAEGRASAAESVLPDLGNEQGVSLIKLYAAREAERPNEVRKQLQSLGNSPAILFISKTFQAEQELLKHGELEPSELLAAPPGRLDSFRVCRVRAHRTGSGPSGGRSGPILAANSLSAHADGGCRASGLRDDERDS